MTRPLAITAAFLALPGVLALESAAQGQESPFPECYLLEEQLESPFPGQPSTPVPWVLCPLDSWRDQGQESPLFETLQELEEDGPKQGRWVAGWVSGLSGFSLNRALCGAVSQVRSLSPEDPDDGRERSAEEIARWWCEVVQALPYDEEEGACDWTTERSAPRPLPVREVGRALQKWGPDDLKVWHDALKVAWPQVARLGCPGMEPR